MNAPTLRDFLCGEFTRQQVFDFTMRKLIEQGKPSTRHGFEGCAYNNVVDGTHCAAGWLMLYLPPADVELMEGSSIESLIRGDWDGRLFAADANEPDPSYPIAGDLPCGGFDRSDVEFLSALQSAHDEAAVSTLFANALRYEARKVAGEYDLDASVLADGARE